MNDNIDLFASAGSNLFKTRTNPSTVEPDIIIDNNLKLAGFAYQNDHFSNLHAKL